MRVPDKYREAKSEIVAIYYENKERYGYRRITAELHNREFSINHKTVQRLMKALGLVCRVRIKKYRSYKGEVWKIAPNLLNRNFYAEKPNQKWVTDVTEFWTCQYPYRPKVQGMKESGGFAALAPLQQLL